MIYVFDTSSFRVLGNYYPDRFPSFWEMFDELVAAGRIVSVREVHRELDVLTMNLLARADSHDRSIWKGGHGAE